MVNTYLQFEGKIHCGSKVIAITRNDTKLSSFKVILILKIKVKVTCFQTHLRCLDINEQFKYKGKILNWSI